MRKTPHANYISWMPVNSVGGENANGLAYDPWPSVFNLSLRDFDFTLNFVHYA